MKRKICFVTTGDIKTIATSKRALGMANPLAELGWNVSIIMMDTEENRHRASMECNNNIDVFFFKPSSALSEIKEKNKIIKKIDPNYLYICAFVARNIVGIGHHSKKLVEHSELQTGIPDMKGLKKLKAYFTEYLSIFYSDALVNASKYLQKVYKRRCALVLHKNHPCFYHPYAFSSEVLKVLNVSRDLGEFSQFKERKVFTFLGTITKNYGAFTVIEAFSKVKGVHPESVVVMYGRGRHYKNACQYVVDHDLNEWVKLPGFIAEEEISKCFSMTDYFISPMNDTIQDWARCPSKLYMYLPYRKPIVTCKIGEPYEVLKEEGDYYKPSDADSMADTIIHLIESGKTSINIDPDEHSWVARANQFNKWINKTLAK